MKPSSIQELLEPLIDGTKWIAYTDGIVGRGKTMEEAIQDFENKTPETLTIQVHEDVKALKDGLV